MSPLSLNAFDAQTVRQMAAAHGEGESTHGERGERRVSLLVLAVVTLAVLAALLI